MNYITDYQLDINKGFVCKVNGITFTCEFKYNPNHQQWFISQILLVADAMEIPRQEFIGIFNSKHVNHVIYCDSKQQCYNLCQHIVNTYFMPNQTGHERLVPDIHFIYNDKFYQFTLKTLDKKYVWQNVNDICTHIFIKTHPDLLKIKKELNINISISPHSEYLGFDTKEDAIKFAKYVIKYYYSRTDEKESGEKSRRYLTKYYDGSRVSICNHTFILTAISSGVYWQLDEMKSSSLLYTQFSLTDIDVEEICKSLDIHITWYQRILGFSNTHNAIKFTDYLIETYIIKKEKTYDTNQLRKERATISRGAKPAGGIIHGRRGKASIRRGCIKHQTCISY